MVFCHLASSVAKNSLSSSGDEPRTSMPCAVNWDTRPGLRSAALVLSFRRLTMSAGTFAGARSAYQTLLVKPGSPASEVVGRSCSHEIGRAHAELQSLMRISYAVLCLKKQN